MRRISPKRQAKHLHALLRDEFTLDITLNQAQHLTARTLGYGSWQELRAQPAPRMGFELILEVGHDDYDGFVNPVPSTMQSVLCRDKQHLNELTHVLMELEHWHEPEHFSFHTGLRMVALLPEDEYGTPDTVHTLFYEMTAEYGVTRPSPHAGTDTANHTPRSEP
ncbi:hypothetical protein [Deinococcus soli (ex Cha et al. 2016)]|uniref:Uncharacterized protein n=2 Tax=Deinococcus soli (ex Cha et al. 2016) TaxID=1309411 RepID=A0ACC6KH04_9DEIO|nr:hypothetical protein [Deinococcus soli (ex Cha et al. 2016)]MDR6218864.1 hypothetical protein [Deinococcus soli (ex Cha et al. 2016)]MDR6328661.1 hypothetical protein [Deinococcus soli (ex Cha et al. 2016)]MDR6751852.1 hypothetical protein [Deinococcus soli (ex Cha et al. 2016)]